MQQHYQVINLHNIIKTQQIKIHQLQQQIQAAYEKQHITDTLKAQQTIGTLQQQNQTHKQTIKQLQQQLSRHQKQQQYQYVKLETQRKSYQRDQSMMDRQLITYKKKCIELQGKLKRTQNDMIVMTDKYQHQANVIKAQLMKNSDYKTNLSAQVAKLNHFYKNSIFEIAKRKQTLLWVDKFTQYLQLQQDNTINSKNQHQITSAITSQLTSFHKQITTMIQSISQQQNKSIYKIMTKQQQLQQLLQAITMQSEQSMSQNQQLWSTYMKQEQQASKTSQIKQYKQQLESVSAKYAKSTQMFNGQVRRLQDQKKILILGFQQLKSLNEHRQRTYREQIKKLKQTIECLINNGQQRDMQFQQQIFKLNKQISVISDRYNQGVEYPLRKITDRTDKTNKQIMAIKQSQQFKGLIKSMDTMLHRYITNKDYQHLRSKIQCYINHSTSIMQTFTTLLTCPNNSIQSNNGDNSHNNNSNSRVHKQLQDRQKLNKSIYEATLSKKHLSSLQAYCQQLQKKQGCIELGPRKNNHKIMAVQAENQALKQSVKLLREAYQQQIHVLKSDNLMLTKQLQGISTTNHLMNSAMARIKETNETLVNFINNQEQIFAQINNNLLSMKQLFAEPVANFEEIMRKMNNFTDEKSRIHNYSQPQHGHSNSSFQVMKQTNGMTPDDMKQYKQILTKRSDNCHSTQKCISQLIRVIRETQSKHKQHQHSTQADTYNMNLDTHMNTSKSTTNSSNRGLAKKLKQVQAQRIKQRQQYAQNITKLQASLKTISNQMNKTVSMKQALAKLQWNFDGKINELLKKAQMKTNNNKTQLSAIRADVIADLRAKLSEANAECQGLRREMTIQYTAKKQ